MNSLLLRAALMKSSSFFEDLGKGVSEAASKAKDEINRSTAAGAEKVHSDFTQGFGTAARAGVEKLTQAVAEGLRGEASNYDTLRRNASLTTGLIGALGGALGGGLLGAAPGVIYNTQVDPKDPHRKARVLAGALPGALVGGGVGGLFGQRNHVEDQQALDLYEAFTGRKHLG